MSEIDAVRIQFSEQNLFLLNMSLGFIMFGVALNLVLDDFRRLFQNPRPALVGVASQFVLLPALTFCLIWVFEPVPSIALGMVLIAACPGGNISNFMSANAGGNTALSVTLTAVSTVLAILMTPLNLSFWGSLYAPAAPLLTSVDVSFSNVFETVTLILGVPLILGMAVRHFLPAPAKRLARLMQTLSIAIFAVIVVMALVANYEHLMGSLIVVFDLVLIHNTIALSGGYLFAVGAGLATASRQTLALETGIQNSGLGLILIFNFFDGMGGMALVAGWWGIWHIVSGLALSSYWRYRSAPTLATKRT